MKTICGIDPGKNGAIAILTGTLNYIYPMPIIQGTGELDIFYFEKLLRTGNRNSQEITIFLEDVHAIFSASAKSTFNFGFICGQINTVCRQFATTVLIQPKVWQKEVWIEEDIVGIPTKRKYKKSGLPIFKTDTKKTSFNAVKRIFPLINIPTTPKSHIPHDGLVDSLLIAEYGRRTYK